MKKLCTIIGLLFVLSFSVLAADPQVLQATAAGMTTLANTFYVNVPGTQLTLPQGGTWLLIATAEVGVSKDDAEVLIYINANGVMLPGRIAANINNGKQFAVGTFTQAVLYQAPAGGAVVKLQAISVTAYMYPYGHSSICSMLPDTGGTSIKAIYIGNSTNTAAWLGAVQPGS